jgi:hypothetical protein
MKKMIMAMALVVVLVGCSTANFTYDQESETLSVELRLQAHPRALPRIFPGIRRPGQIRKIGVAYLDENNEVTGIETTRFRGLRRPITVQLEEYPYPEMTVAPVAVDRQGNVYLSDIAYWDGYLDGEPLEVSGIGWEIILPHEITPVGNPKKVGSFPDILNSQDITVEGQYAFWVSSTGNPVVDNVRSGMTFFDLVDGYVYIANWANGLRIYDLADPYNPIDVAHYDDGGYVRDVSVVDNYAYIISEHAGLRILDVTDPYNPVEVGSYDTEITVVNQYAYIANWHHGLTIIDVSDPTNPVEVSRDPILGWQTHRVAVDGNYAYLSWVYEGLMIVDISDPANPVEVGNVYDDEFQTQIHHIQIYDTYVYVVDEYQGMRAFDVSDPANPLIISQFYEVEYVGPYDINSYARGIDFSGKYAYIVNYLTGLSILDLTQPAE